MADVLSKDTDILMEVSVSNNAQWLNYRLARVDETCCIFKECTFGEKKGEYFEVATIHDNPYHIIKNGHAVETGVMYHLYGEDRREDQFALEFAAKKFIAFLEKEDEEE